MRKTTAQKLRPLQYRGSDASMVGATEPSWPDTLTQELWTPSHRNIILGPALNWYHSTQDSSAATTFLAQWLDNKPKRRDLAQLVRKYGSPSVTLSWLARCATQGLVLKLAEVRKIHQALSQLLNQQLTESQSQAEKLTIKKPNIQDRINEKMRECAGEIQAALDEFCQSGCAGEPNLVGMLVRYNVPQARVRELSARLDRQIQELELVQAGTDPQLVEGYSNFNKRQIRSMLWWLTRAQEQILSYGTLKAASRKPVVRKGQTPQKLVSKLKFMDRHEELKLESIDPVQILKATELWVYNVNRRKLGVYVADETQGSLYVKNSRILGYSETKSVCKTIRKPDVQLKQFMAAGKPASKKWFEDLKTTQSTLNGRITPEFLLLKVYK
jgi:hypothetical protein